MIDTWQILQGMRHVRNVKDFVRTWHEQTMAWNTCKQGSRSKKNKTMPQWLQIHSRRQNKKDWKLESELFHHFIDFLPASAKTLKDVGMCHCLLFKEVISSFHRCLFPQGSTMLFLCAQNSSDNGTFFFRTMKRNNTDDMLMPTETVRPQIDWKTWKHKEMLHVYVICNMPLQSLK